MKSIAGAKVISGMIWHIGRHMSKMDGERPQVLCVGVSEQSNVEKYYCELQDNCEHVIKDILGVEVITRDSSQEVNRNPTDADADKWLFDWVQYASKHSDRLDKKPRALVINSCMHSAVADYIIAQMKNLRNVRQRSSKGQMKMTDNYTIFGVPCEILPDKPPTTMSKLQRTARKNK